MGREPSSTGPTGEARPWPRRLVRAAVRLLPSGPVREGYRAEFLADLAELSPRAQLRYALGVLLSAVALRRAATGARAAAWEPAPARRPLLCRTNLHHRWRRVPGENGQDYTCCARCGKERWTGLQGDSSVAANVTVTWGSVR